MTHLNFSPRLIGVALRPYSSQKFLADQFDVTVLSLFPPQALSYPVPQNFAVLRRLRTPSEAIASRLA
jgi:hypothetical protein